MGHISQEQLGPIRQHAVAIGNRGSGRSGSLHLLHQARDKVRGAARNPSVAAHVPARGHRDGLPRQAVASATIPAVRTLLIFDRVQCTHVYQYAVFHVLFGS
jgi:hypothetical protein